jgi:hypothetical protein
LKFKFKLRFVYHQTASFDAQPVIRAVLAVVF